MVMITYPRPRKVYLIVLRLIQRFMKSRRMIGGLVKDTVGYLLGHFVTTGTVFPVHGSECFLLLDVVELLSERTWILKAHKYLTTYRVDHIGRERTFVPNLDSPGDKLEILIVYIVIVGINAATVEWKTNYELVIGHSGDNMGTICGVKRTVSGTLTCVKRIVGRPLDAGDIS